MIVTSKVETLFGLKMFWLVNLKRRDHLEILGIDERTVLE
jgi:hypothetical protein